VNDWTEYPEEQKWIKHVLDELVPMIEDTSLTISIVPRIGTDVKFAVELGFSIMYDKPIILAVFPGTVLPDHLRRVADEIVEFSDGDDDDANRSQLHAAIDRVTARL
jgi:hypothetical protein